MTKIHEIESRSNPPWVVELSEDKIKSANGAFWILKIMIFSFWLWMVEIKGSEKVHGNESRKDPLVVYESCEDRTKQVFKVAVGTYPATQSIIYSANPWIHSWIFLSALNYRWFRWICPLSTLGYQVLFYPRWTLKPRVALIETRHDVFYRSLVSSVVMPLLHGHNEKMKIFKIQNALLADLDTGFFSILAKLCNPR